MTVSSTKKKILIFAPKREETKVNEVIKKIDELEGSKPIWSKEGYFYIDRQVSSEIISKIKTAISNFSMPDIIRGYYGCPVTGECFAWR